MAESNFKTRIIHKHDIESNWNKAETFIPKQGEIIVYDRDDNNFNERFKIGDGITTVKNLSFYLEEEILDILNKIDGLQSTTANKVSVSDIVNNLTTNVSNKPLSAAQGVTIKGLINALQTEVDGKSDSVHNHTVSEITDLTATATELNYVDGVTSNIQTQLDEKLATSGGTLTGELIVDGSINIHGTAASHPLIVRNIAGSTSNGAIGPLYLQYGADDIIKLGNGGRYSISSDGGTYSGTSAKATSDASGNVITSTYETKADASSKLTSANEYTDTAISNLINGAPTTLDTLGEIATAMEENVSVVEALEASIGNKANASDLTSHTGNKSNPHGVTLTQLGVTATAAELNYISGVTSDVQAQVDGKAALSHTHGNITNAGAIGTTSGKAVITTTNGILTTGTVPVASGGTGATTAAAALSNLGLTATAAELNKLDGVTATTAELNKLDGLTATTTELNYIDGVTSNIQAQLDGKAATSHGTHVSYSTTAPVMDGTASVGTASTVARSDHKHPTDTSRASKTEFDSHNSDTTKHITSTERTNWNAAKTHADSAHAPSDAEKNQNAFSNITVGSTTVAADTTTDTVTFVGSNVTITPDATNDKITFAVASGSTSAKGIVQLTNSTSSTSTTTAATPSSVKSAYDLANTAKTNAATAQTRADSAYTLAEGKADSLSDLGVTATATELNYISGVTSDVQAQIDGKAASSHTHNYAGSSSAGGAATSANKLNTNAGSATQPVYFSNGVPVKTTYTLGKSVPSNAVFTDTDTHYTSKNVVGATNATSNTTTALTNGNVYLNSVENGEVTSTHKISGSGATTVTTDANGNIVISSTDNNTTYSAAGSSLGLVKSGGDVTISSGVITVKDDSHNHTIANIDNLQSTLDSMSEDIDTSISALSVSGKVITYTKNDGTTGTITTQDTNTDTKVTQTVTTTDAEYPLLASNTANRTATGTEVARFASGVTLNPADKSITATTFIGTLSGNATSATTATSATSATKATKDGSGNTITSTYETKTDASSKLAEAKTYADNAATTVKNDLLNGAGTAYDTLKELGDLIDDNQDAIDALEAVAAGKANAEHTHVISDVSGLQSALDGKAASSHTHTISNVTNLQSTLDAKVPTSRTVNGKTLSSNIILSASDVDAYSKTEIDNMELITIADIDTICGVNN